MGVEQPEAHLFDMNRHALKTGLMVFGWTLIFYATSAASGIWNKELVGGLSGVSPTVLTLLHLIVSLLSDVAVMRYSKEGVPQFPPMHGRHSTWDIFRCFLPVAVFVTLSKLTTYMSYQHVSVSLSHTAKASEPIWNVIVAALVFGEFYTQPVYLSLVPIAFGVALASVTDFTYNHTGFFWAVVSAIMKVLQNIYTKRLMIGGKFTFWEIHFFCGASSLLILLPVLLFQASSVTWAGVLSFPLFGLIGCSVLQYASSVSSYAVLHLVTHLTFTIINVLKRLFIIVAGMLYTHQQLRPLNTLGVLLAISGILAYNIVKDVGTAAPSVDLLHPSTWAGWAALLHARYIGIWRPKDIALQRSDSSGVAWNDAPAVSALQQRTGCRDSSSGSDTTSDALRRQASDSTAVDMEMPPFRISDKLRVAGVEASSVIAGSSSSMAGPAAEVHTLTPGAQRLIQSTSSGRLPNSNTAPVVALSSASQGRTMASARSPKLAPRPHVLTSVVAAAAAGGTGESSSGLVVEVGSAGTGGSGDDFSESLQQRVP